jgi:hypothetical protein
MPAISSSRVPVELLQQLSGSFEASPDTTMAAVSGCVYGRCLQPGSKEHYPFKGGFSTYATP